MIQSRSYRKALGMEKSPTVSIQRRVERNPMPNSGNSVSFDVIEELATEERTLDTHTVVLSTPESCYQSAFLAGLKYARRHQRALRDDVAGLREIAPEHLLDPLKAEFVEQAPQTAPSGVVAKTSGQEMSFHLAEDKTQTRGHYYFAVLLAPVIALAWFTLEDRVNQIGISFFLAMVVLAIVFSQKEQNKYHGKRELLLTPDKILVVGADEERKELLFRDLVHLAAHPRGLTLFTEKTALHFPERDLETSRWLRGAILDYYRKR